MIHIVEESYFEENCSPKLFSSLGWLEFFLRVNVIDEIAYN
jgi:hypothetical protein